MVMSREEAVETIVCAVRWLNTSPQTHIGYMKGYVHIVEVMATTSDLRHGVSGVHFGNTFQFRAGAHGQWMHCSAIKLVNHADRESWRDFVPVTNVPTEEDPRLTVHDRQAVDMHMLRSFSDERLIRMARNALHVMQEYGADSSPAAA